MPITLEEAKQYLHIDYEDDDALLGILIAAATRLCMDVVRTDDADVFAAQPNAHIAVLYAVAYLYEHREEADHKALTLTLRALLFGCRREDF